MSRFQLAHISDIAADVVDERGLKVGSICLIEQEESLWVNSDAIGRLHEQDLDALKQLMRRRSIDREYGS